MVKKKMNINYEFYITPKEYEIAFMNGISRRLLDTRVRELGWSKKEAITKRPTYNTDLKFYIKIAKENGIKEGTFLTRIRRLKWSMEEAATIQTKTRKECASLIGGHNKKYPKEVYRKLRENGISLETFRHRIKKGWTIEDATTIRPMTKKEASKIGAKRYKEIYGHTFGYDFGMNNKFRGRSYASYRDNTF